MSMARTRRTTRSVDRFSRIHEQIEKLSEGEETWPDETKANAGAFVGIDHDGDLHIRRGLIRPEDKATARKTTTQGANGTGKRTKPISPACPPR